MKDLTVFHESYKTLLTQGKSILIAFLQAKEAQGFFDKYIAEQIEASKLQPVDAKAAMQDFTEAISLNPDTAGKCNGNCGMNYCDDNGCIERKRNLVEDVPCKSEAFVPCWEWLEREHNATSTSVHDNQNGFYFRIQSDPSSLYPTLEAAQLEAERYYRLYVEPNLKK